MVFADWTKLSGVAELDASTKYSGNSSVRITRTWGSDTDYGELEHNTFLEPQCQMIFQIRSNYYFTGIDYGIYFVPFGYVDIRSYITLNTWEKFKLTFWYDIPSNTKWSRIEKWVASAWVEQGSDHNWGSGSPTAGKLRLRADQTYSKYVWFDEVEVYS